MKSLRKNRYRIWGGGGIFFEMENLGRVTGAGAYGTKRSSVSTILGAPPPQGALDPPMRENNNSV